MKQYEKVAKKIREQIDSGILKDGERLPGVRKLANSYSVSVSTIQEALHILEREKYLDVINRSGHYVKHIDKNSSRNNNTENFKLKPMPVESRELAIHLVTTSLSSDIYQLGTTVPHTQFLPSKAVNLAVKKISREQPDHSDRYSFAPGYRPLREQIALRMLEAGCDTHADEIVITNGCQSAVNIALSAVCKPGDTVAVESPTFHGLLQILESKGLQVIEIPTNEKLGINLGALELALQQWPVKACVVLPNFSNPLGYCMPDTRKKALAKLMKQHNVPLIENDIHGDLGFNQRRPKAIKSFDDDNVIYCSSFSKTISPGFRVGWIHAPHMHNQIIYFQMMHSLAAASLPQKALTHYLSKQGYGRHLRQVRARYIKQVRYVSEMITAHFPVETKINFPEGGFVIWVELPKQVSALRLYDAAIQKNISIGAGPLFSANKKYENCIRLNCALPIDEKLQNALIILSQLVNEQMESPTS
ncbi:aminotransferase-like domain-containing protein [Aurantivibrio infirmus]